MLILGMAKVYNKKVSGGCEAQVSDCCRHSYRVFRFVLYDVTEKERVPFPPGVHTLFLNGGGGMDLNMDKSNGPSIHHTYKSCSARRNPCHEASGTQFLF